MRVVGAGHTLLKTVNETLYGQANIIVSCLELALFIVH